MFVGESSSLSPSSVHLSHKQLILQALRGDHRPWPDALLRGTEGREGERGREIEEEGEIAGDDGHGAGGDKRRDRGEGEGGERTGSGGEFERMRGAAAEGCEEREREGEAEDGGEDHSSSSRSQPLHERDASGLPCTPFFARGGALHCLYITPEMFEKNMALRSALLACYQQDRLSLVVIDVSGNSGMEGCSAGC